MRIIGQIILGLLIVVVSVVLVAKNYQVANAMPLRFIEDKMGPGSSYLIWKLIAIIGVFVGFMVMFGFWDNVLTMILSPVTNLINPNTN